MKIKLGMMGNKQVYAKIKDIGIIRRYGFCDGGYMVVQCTRKNKNGNYDTYTFSERSPWVENYAMFCGIYKEVDLEKLIGKRVVLTFGEDEYGKIVYLSYPTAKISESRHFYVMSERIFD